MNHLRNASSWGGFLALLFLCASVPARGEDALLVVAHGARHGEWNQRVARLVEQVNWPGPVGVAFLMEAPPEHALDTVAARLDQAGVERIVVVPLLLSSFSGHYEELRYYVGQRAEPPEHVHYAPLHTRAKLVLTPAMDDHPLVSQILADQVRPLIAEPSRESVVLVAHGPNEEDDNQRWLERLGRHARPLRETYGFQRVEVVTLRDDAPKAVRDAATEHLRATVQAAAADSRVLVVPVLISVGRIQQQIRERLQGLDYVMSESGLAEHPLAAEWVLQQALEVRATAAAQR